MKHWNYDLSDYVSAKCAEHGVILGKCRVKVEVGAADAWVEYNGRPMKYMGSAPLGDDPGREWLQTNRIDPIANSIVQWAQTINEPA